MMANAGVTWKVGNRDGEAETADRYRKGPISSTYAMQRELAAMKAENQGLKGEVADLKAENEQMKANIAAMMARPVSYTHLTRLLTLLVVQSTAMQ